jgi:agmatine deiminase
MRELPVDLGYRMPAEWERHAATWLAWPHNQATWPERFEPIPGVWAGLVETLCAFEPVQILAGDGPAGVEARNLAGNLPSVTFHDLPTNDAWVRDFGPMFLVGPPGAPPALVNWGYNAWGGKYPPFDLDDSLPRKLAERLGYRSFEPGVILEGGAVDFNGQGSVLTSEQCLLNTNRNPQLSQPEIERYLADYCAARHVIWLGAGIVGDDTDGHVDELARFVAPRVVAAARESDPADENYAALEDNFRRLSLATDEQGRPLEVVALPMPRPVRYHGQRLPASYANFYIANGLVIVPQFDDAADAQALEILARLFADRQVRGLRAVELAWGLGAFHCITQQQPAV